MDVRTAFGLNLTPEFALPGLRVGQRPGAGWVAIRLVQDEDIERLWSGGEAISLWRTQFDGLPFEIEEGHEGSHLMTYGKSARFLLTADRRTLLCAAHEVRDPAWRRLLLDTVLWATSLLSGFDALHAAAVLVGDRLVALAAHSGGGKTTLLAELIRRGGSLFTDDILALSEGHGRVLAHPGPTVVNLPAALAYGQDLLPIRDILAAFPHEDEVWVELEATPAFPSSIAAIVLLERAPGLEGSITPVTPSPLSVLPHSLGRWYQQDRQRQRFELLSTLVTQAPIFSLQASLDEPAASLAELVESVVGSGVLAA